MNFEPLKVGELAKRTGLTVRALHHYDDIGLLTPSLHTESGHRLYAASDIARLHQIITLRQLGFSLEEIGSCLERPEYSPVEVVRTHVTRLRQQIELQKGLCERLDALMSLFQKAGEVSADVFLQTIEVMNMIQTYYTPEQLESFRKRREEMGPAGETIMQQGQNDWAQLIAELTAEMHKGTDPADPKMQVYEKRRQALVNAFTGGDKAIEQNLKRLWTEQGDKLSAQFGYDPKLMDYLTKVAAANEKDKK